MKKTLASFLALFLTLSAPSVFAQMPMGVPMTPAATPAFEKVGVVAAAQGKIELKTPGQVGRIAQSGQATDKAVTEIWTAPETLGFIRDYVAKTLKKS